jgi:hypothetical protein
LAQWTQALGTPDIAENDTVPDIIRKLASAAHAFATSELARIAPDYTATANDYPYFGFIPLLRGKAVPNGPAVTWEGRCFKSCSVQVSATSANATTMEVVLTTADAKSLLCTETLLLGTVQQYSVQEVIIHGTKKITWDMSKASPNELWDLLHSGVRVFEFQDNIKNLLSDVAQTAELFISDATQGVPKFVAQKNMDFLKKYRGIDMQPRTTTDNVLNETQIQSGDFFGIIRLDGLDPMLAWAMGAATGHTTVALWGDDGELYVCESTVKDSYWPVNGVQKTPYRQWIANAKAADFNVVHLPLAPEYRAKFNVTAAWEWFATVEGLDYGYNNMLWGWVDTVQDNYPCVPPDYERCLTWDVIEVVFPIISKLVPIFHTFYDQAFNKRLGTEGLDFAGILREASDQNMAANLVPTLVEEDGWMYNRTRYGKAAVGPSMVCCVFVCHTWKAGGMFGDIGDDINCGELTNWDDSSMKVYDASYVLPESCKEADPSNPVCQILGEYTLVLDHYNSKAPYAHMAEKCPGVAPNYTRPDTC